MPPVLIDAVLSALIWIHESTWNWSYGPLLAYGLSAACAPPAMPAPRTLKPTIIAPPPFKNDVRENSLLVISVTACSLLLSFMAIAAATSYRVFRRGRRRGRFDFRPQ